MFWWILTPAALVWGRRTGIADSPAVNLPDPCELISVLSVQKVSALVARAATGGSTEVCFEVQRSLSYSQSAGQKFGGKLHRGEFECVQLKDQSQSNERALASLADGESVRFSRSSNWVVCAKERNGCRVKEVALERPVTVLNVGAEVSRTLKGTQEVTAEYQGSIKQEPALLLVASGVDSSSAELACFRTTSAEDYVIEPPTVTPVGQLGTGDEFCIRLEDQSPETAALVGGLAKGDTVRMKWEHREVVYNWRNGDSTDSETVWEYKLTTQKNAEGQ